MNQHHRRGRAFGDLTIYGRKPVLEALQDSSIQVLRLHMSSSNRTSALTRQLLALAREREVPVSLHGKLELSRISKNSRQDQGVAADLQCPSLREASELSAQHPARHLIALDRINNPQNLGMAIRSVAASSLDGLLLSREPGNTRLSPLVVKASAGTFFKTPIYSCHQLAPTLRELQDEGYHIITLQADASDSLFALSLPRRSIFVLGNESDGVSADIAKLADQRAAIPLRRGVESLNVAVTAALVAFLTQSSA
jgi:23S rRNA (guanosine2251-2'-O)-methyltransferase